MNDSDTDEPSRLADDPSTAADEPWTVAAEHAWQVLQDALATASGTGDPAVTLASSVVEAALAVAGTVVEPPDVHGPEPTQDMAARQALGWYHWFRYQALPEGEDEDELLAAVVVLLPLIDVRPDIVPASLADLFHASDDGRADRLAALGTALLRRARATPEREVARAAVDVLERAVTAMPGGPQEADVTGNLATAWLTCFERTSDLSLLDHAVDCARRAAALPSEGQHSLLGNLGAVLLARHRRTRSPDDLAGSISASRAALAGAPHSPVVLVQLGSALRIRHQRQARRADLEEAEALCRRAVDIVDEDHPLRPTVLSQLGSCLQDRFDLTDDREVLSEAIRTQRTALESLPEDHPERTAIMVNLGNSLRTLAVRLGDRDAAEQAVRLGRLALEPLHGDRPERPLAASGLAAALRVWFQMTGDAQALRESVTLFRQVLDGTGPEDPYLLGRLSNLGTSLWASYEHSGRTEDLEEALEVLRDPRAGRALRRADPANVPAYLNNLATALLTAHERTGDLSLLDEAVDAGREGVEAAADPVRRALCLSVVGNALLTRFEMSAAEAYLHEALAAMEGAVSALPPDHGDRPRLLSNLGNALRLHHDRTGRQASLDRSVDVLRRSVEATPDEHPDRISYLINLAASLNTRYETGKDIAYLQETVEILRRAVRESVPEGYDRTSALSNLGTALFQRYERLKVRRDLEEAIQVLCSATERLADTHPHRAVSLGHLGTALRARHRLTGRRSDLDDAVEAFRSAAHSPNAPVSLQLAGARHCADAAAAAGRPQPAMDAYRRAFALLPKLVARQLSRFDQEHQLGLTAGLAGDAAACALHHGDRALALQFLEQGRGLVFGQLLDIRSDLSDLRFQAPQLADRLEGIGRALDVRVAPSVRNSIGPVAGPRIPREAEDVRAVERRADLNQAWESTLAEIRKLPGRSGFLAPPSPDDLLAETVAGPVVALNISALRSDALILTPDRVEVVHLPGAEPGAVREQVNILLEAVSAAHDPAVPLEDSGAAQDTLHELLEWLWDTIAEPVMDTLKAIDALDDPDGTRLWWMPTGALAFLPLHAAGHHRAGAGRSVLDRAVSSYTPTIRALRHLRRRQPSTPRPVRLLAVGLAQTEGAAHLAGTAEEAFQVGTSFPEHTVLSGPEATRDRVLELLPDHPWVHFACHGFSDPASPSRSRLLLHDHHIHPLTVLDIDHLRLSSAQFAFLSACSTAQTSAVIPDESLHIAAAFLLAGFPQVVATLWPLNDHLAVEFAENFYNEVSPGRPSVAGARVLHTVVRRHRAWYLDAPSLWACHIHTGT
jgi:tetratricopeptide (TPR) repeat protein